MPLQTNLLVGVTCCNIGGRQSTSVPKYRTLLPKSRELRKLVLVLNLYIITTPSGHIYKQKVTF